MRWQNAIFLSNETFYSQKCQQHKVITNRVLRKLTTISKIQNYNLWPEIIKRGIFICFSLVYFKHLRTMHIYSYSPRCRNIKKTVLVLWRGILRTMWSSQWEHHKKRLGHYISVAFMLLEKINASFSEYFRRIIFLIISSVP